MIKKVSKKIILLLFAFAFSISCVNAADSTYTVSNSTETYGKSDHSPLLNGNYWVSYLTTWNLSGVSDKVYCISPGDSKPSNGTEYVKKSLGDKQATFDYICSQIKDAEEYEKGTILKLAGVLYLGQDTNSDTYAYKDFFNKTTKFQGTTIDDSKARTILSEAAKATSSTSNVSATQEGNKITLITSAKTTISVSDGYTISINGTDKGNSTTVEPSSKTTYIIKVVAPESGSITNAVVSISYDQADAGTSTATASEYAPSSKTGAAKDVQLGISCDYSGTSNKCDSGFNEDGTSCKTTFTVNEEGKKITCSDPSVTTNTGSAGDGLCDLTGNTVVDIKENYATNETEPTDDELYCIKQKSTDATELVYGTDNDYCKVYCTENIKMTLPGPDANNDAQTSANENSNVFINAGSFFTIEGEMSQTNEVTCYSVFDYQTYQSTIYAYREAVVNAYNNYSKTYALKNASNDVTDSETNITTCQLTGTDTYKTLSINPTTGEITSSTATLTTADCSIKDAEVSSAKTSLTNAISTAKTGIAAEQKKWGECFNFSIDNILTEIKGDCDAEITFTYADSECGDYKLVKDGDATSTTPTGTTKEASSGTVNVGVCDESGSGCNSNDSYKLVKYISLQSTVTTKYKFDNDFTINLETGAVSCDAQTGDEYSDVYSGFPVKTTAVQAKYTYNYNYSGIGHDLSSNSCEAGRFDDKISKKSFGCYFDVNSCKECNIKCTGDGCSADYDECDDACKLKCTGGGCIVDGNGGLLATYKTISLNSEFALNPLIQDKTAMLAYADTSKSSQVSSTTSSVANGSFSNWDTDKGQAAESQILSDSESVYSKDPEYKITLTPSIMKEIKNYNSKNGAYATSDLDCINYNNYGICISSFIHDTFASSFEIKTGNVSGDNTTTYNGVTFASYADTAAEFVGPAWK